MPKTDPLVEEYAVQIEPLLPLAKRAYGSRDTVSPQHDASREYTRLLCEFDSKGGSLLKMADRLGVTYAGLRRRVTTAALPASSKRPRKKFTEQEINDAVDAIKHAKRRGTETYHKEIKYYYDLGYSLAAIAKRMGISSANPLYYGKNQVELKERGI